MKTFFTRMATDDCQCPPGLPCVCGADPQFRLVARGARRPTAGRGGSQPPGRGRPPPGHRTPARHRPPDRPPAGKWPDGPTDLGRPAPPVACRAPSRAVPGPAPTAAGPRARPPHQVGHAVRPPVDHVGVGRPRRREPPRRGGRRRPGQRGPGPAGRRPRASWRRPLSTQKSLSGGGGREGRAPGGGGPSQAAGPYGHALRGRSAPGTARRPASRSPDGAPPQRSEPIRPAGPAHPCHAAGAGPGLRGPVVRLVGVQEFSHQHYASLSTSELAQTVTVPAVRGAIYDRNGEVLAESVTKQTVVADPLLITHPAATAAALSPGPRDPDRPAAERAHRALGLRLPRPPGVRRGGGQGDCPGLAGINLVPESQRVQPDGQLALPVVGSTGWNGNGTSGLEYQYQSLLAGQVRLGEPVGVARRGGVARLRQGLGGHPARHRAGADHRRVCAVRRRAGPRRRDRRLPRLQRHRRGRGREDGRHPGHGRSPGDVRVGDHRGHRGRQAGTRTFGHRVDVRSRPWCPERTPFRPGWRRRRRTQPSPRSTSRVRCSSWSPSPRPWPTV